MFERFGVLFLFFLLLNQVSRNIYSFLSNILFSTSPLYLLGKASSGRPRQRRLFIPSASSYQRRIIPCLSPNLSGLLSILTLSQQQDHRIGDPLDPLQSQLTQERIDFLCFFSFMPFLVQVHHKENENQDLLYQVSNGNCEQIEHPSVISIQLHES